MPCVLSALGETHRLTYICSTWTTGSMKTPLKPRGTLILRAFLQEIYIPLASEFSDISIIASQAVKHHNSGAKHAEDKFK